MNQDIQLKKSSSETLKIEITIIANASTLFCVSTKDTQNNHG